MGLKKSNNQDWVAILDFGSQYTHLIARRVRECGVYSEVVANDESGRVLLARAPKAIILSGGPASVISRKSPMCDREIFNIDVPILGICYGAQFMAKLLGGKVSLARAREYGKAILKIKTRNNLFKGLLKEEKVWTQYFKKEADTIILLGTTKEELGGSEYLKEVYRQVKDDAPDIDLDLEQAVQSTALEAIRKGLISSAHDCSEGGLAVALAECCISNKENMVGAVIDGLIFEIRTDAILFGESQSSVILSCSEKNASKIRDIAPRFGVHFKIIERTGGKELKIVNGKRILVNLLLERMSDKWANSLQSLIMV